MAKIKVHSYGAEKKKGANIKTTMPNNTGSGLGYVAGRIGTGVASVFEGTGKLIKGTAALLSGDELYAKYVFTKSQVGEWREALEEYYNPGDVMSFFGDVGEGVGQSSVMLADALTHFLGTGMFFAGIGGNSVGNAVSMTGNVGLREYAYGLTVAGAEAALERYVGAGGRAVTNLIKPGAKSAAKSAGKAAAKRATRNGLLKNILYSGAGEFVEEFLGDFVDVTAQKMYSINKNAEYSLSNALYSGLVGFFSGAVMGGATQSAQAATYINAGSKVQRNGNVDSLLKQADLIAENFATMGGGKTERTQMNHYMKAIQASYDAYTALSEDAKMGTKGALYLGEMQGAMAGLQGAYGVEKSKEYILSKAEKFADYASKREGKTYTVQDLLANKDNILNNLAIEHFAGQFMTAPEYEQFERGIRDVIRKEGAAETAERMTFEEMEFDPAEAKRASESVAYEDAVTMISESETWDGESDVLYKVPSAGYVYVRSHGDGSYTVGEGTAESYLSGDIIMAKATEAEVREILARESENAKEAPAEAEVETVTEEVAEFEESQTSEEATSEESETEVKSAEEKKNSLRKKKEKAKETPAEQTEEDKARQKTRMERAQIQDRARKAVPDFDLQPVDVRTAIEAMYRSAAENGASAEAADAAAHLIAVLGGTEIRFQKGIVANGLTDIITDNEGNKKRLILVNPRTDAEGGATTTLLHEVTHLLEGAKGYEQLSKIALGNYAKEKADELRQRYRDYAEKHGKTFSDEYLDQEVTAEAVGELLTKGKYIARLRNRAPIVNSITYLGRIMRGLIGKNRAAYNATRKLWMAFYKCLATNAVEAKAEIRRYSFAGVRAKTADYMKLSTAEEMLANGTDEETVRQATGWFKGYDGKWRFEIDDRELKISTTGGTHRNPDIRRYDELVKKVYFEGNATADEETELRSLSANLKGVNRTPKKLGDLIDHPALFAAYPQLENIDVYFAPLAKSVSGSYHPGFKEIVLAQTDKPNTAKLRKTLIHEIQHAVQDIEHFAGGSNVDVFVDTAERSAYEQYRATAGEIEARDVSERADLTEEERKNTRPDIDRTDVVFAGSGAVSDSIAVLDDGRVYVYASRNVIKGEGVNNWRSQISKFFDQLLDSNSSLDIPTLEGDTLTITKNETAHKARDNYKQTKSQPVKMSDDEFRVKLHAETHIDELAEVARKGKNGVVGDTKSHGFATNGFEYRTAYFRDFDGKYYIITLSIGHGNGIATVYNVGKIEEDTLPSAKLIAVVGSKGPWSASSIDSISHPDSSVNSKSKKYSLPKADLESLYTELNLLNRQDRQRAERWKQAEQQIVADEDYLAAIEEKAAAQTLAQKRAARQRLKALEERYGIPRLVAEKNEIADRQKEIRAQIDELTKAAAEEAEAEGIRKSGKTAEEYHRSLAVKEFGYTSDFNEAGYLLPNGKLLNFSGEKGRHTGERGQDHRAIGIVYANTQGTAALIKFMGEGNIRIMAETPGLDVMQGVEPTAEQYSKIRAYAREMATRNFFNVDITDTSGKTIGSLEYSGKVNPDRIVNDIKAYYQTGEIRKQSEIDRFRYSLPAKDLPKIVDEIQRTLPRTEAEIEEVEVEQATEKKYSLGGKGYDGFSMSKRTNALSKTDSKGNELSEEQVEFFKDSAVRDKKGNLMVLYHGTTANFNTFKKGDVGFHFGTKGAARGRVGYGKNVTLKEVYLNITNPIVFDEDFGSWDADYRLTRELYDRGILTQADAEAVLFADDKRHKRTTESANKKLSSMLLEKGYDGIAYSNTFETAKPTTSYIIFNSEQAKEITNKTPTSDPDIRYSLPAKDVEYMTAVESGDMTSAQKMVDEAAKEAGYDSPLLYHGTQAFGFTEFDPAFSDDGISLFATTSDRMAKTYSGKYGRRAISSASTVTNGDIQKALASVNPKVMIAEGENLQKGVAAGIRSKIKDFENSASLSKLTVPAEYVQALNAFKNNRSAESIDRLAVLFTEEAIQTLWQNSGVALSARRIGKIASMLHSDVAFYVQQADGRVDVLSRDEAIRKARNKLEKLHGNYALYAKTENLFVLDCKGKNWNRLGYTHNGKVYHQTNDIAKLAKAEGYSGVLFKNLVDNGAHGPASGAGDVYVFFDGTQIKSADPVTYDADGNVIPLSERFDATEKDIRYSLPEGSEETVREREEALELKAKREKARADRLQDELHAYKEYGYNAGDVYAIENDRSKEYNGRMDKNVRRRMLLKAKNGIEYLRKYPSAENANKVRGTVDRLIHDYAEEVIYNRKEEVDPQLKEMRSFMKSYRVSISEDLKGDLDRFGGYEAFRRQNMGRGLIMSKDGTPVETIYPELTAAFGEGVFPPSIKNPADQLIHVSEMLKSGVKTDEYVDYEELVRYEERLIRSMLTDVSTDAKRNNRYNPVYNERMAEGYSAPVTTYYAPDGARGLLNATEELVNRWAEANGAVRRRVNGMREKLENEFLYQLNTAKQGELREAAEQMAADLMKASEFLVGAEKVEKINKKGKPYTVWEGGTKYTATKLPGADARALFDELTEEILSRAENEQYRVAGIITASQISAENAALKEEVASLKAQADLASKIKSLHDLAKGKTKPSEKIDFADLNAAVDELSKIVRKGRISPEKAQKFALWFENYLNSKSPTGTILYLRESIPEATREHLATFATLDAEQPGILDQFYLKVFSNLFYELRRAYDNYGMVKMDGEWKYAIDIAKDGVKQAQGSPLNVNRRKGWSKLFRPVKQFMLQAQDPLRTSMMLEGYADNGILSKLIFDVIMGEAERTSMQMDFLKKFEDFFKEHKGYQQKLATKMLKINAFEDSEGKPFEMTLGEAMSFVGLSKREQAKAGLANSDIFFENDEEGTRMVEGGWKRWADMDAEQRISALTGGISEITKQLEQEDMEFFKMVEEFFNKESSAVKRRSDLDYFGHEMAMEEYYFPIYRDSATLSEEVADAAKRMQNFITVSNQSFNKATMKNAQKSLFIANVYDVVTRHATGLATYATLYRPVLNFNTIWNQQTSGNKNSPESMRSVYKRTVWDGIDAYMRNLFDTVQGVTPPKGVLSKVVSKVRGNAVFYQLGINPKTWLTQITSLIASLDVLTVDSLTYGIAHGRAANDEVMDKHSVFARTRDYNMEVAKAEGVEGKIHKVGELSMKPISAVDRMVIRRLWAACQKQVMDTEGHPIGSEENNVAAGKLLDQAILRTQQTAGASTKSGFQRGSELEKSLVMFSSDAMKLLSTLTERIMRNRKYRTDVKNGVEGAQEKLTESNKALRKSAAAVVGVSLMIAMIAQLFKWIYDRDRRKKKDGTEVSVATDVALDSVGNLVGILPLIREVYDYMDSGYEVTDFTLDAFNEIIGGYLNVFETAGSAIGGDYVASEDIWNSVRQAFYSTGMLLGIPVRNANNAFDGFVLNLGVDSVLGTNTHWQYQALFKKPSYQKELDQAIEEGDTNLAELILTTWLEKEKVGEVGDELDTIMELYTKGYDFLPASAPPNLDRAGRTEWMTSMQEAQQLAAQMILSGSWQSMREEAKAASLKKLYRNRQSNLKSKLLGEERTKDGLLAELYGELPVAEIRGLASVTETVEDENGNKTTKREQLEEPLSKYDGEEAILWYLAGYSSKEAKRILAEKVNQIATSEEEKQELYKLLGIDPEDL